MKSDGDIENEEDTYSLNLVGLNRILDHKQHWLRRVTWATVLICSIIGTAYLSTRQGLYYLAKPSTSSVSILRPDSVTLPEVTICLKDKYDFHNLLNLWRDTGHKDKLPWDAEKKLVQETNLTLQQIWTRGGYKFKHLIKKCFIGPGGVCKQDGNVGSWKTTFTRLGKCFTLTGSVTSKSGKLFGIHLSLGYRGHPYGKPFRGYVVAIHNSLMPVPLAIEEGLICNQKLLKNKKKVGCHRLVSINVQSIFLLNKKSSQCSEKIGYSTGKCRTDCLYMTIINKYKCRLPYMDVIGPLCNTVKDIKSVEGAMHHYFFNGNFNYSICECFPPCSYVTYRSSSDTTWNNNKNSVIKIFLEGAETEEVSEIYTFGLSALISQIGGFMGLLMGASGLIFIQATELIIILICHLVKRIFTVLFG